MKHVVALMDIAVQGVIEVESLSVSLTRPTPCTHSKTSSLDLITQCTAGSINSKNRLHIWIQRVPLSTLMPRSYQTHGLLLRAAIIHLNHELAACTVCACGWRLKPWHVFWSSGHTNIQSGVFTVCSSRKEKQYAVEGKVKVMERFDAPCGRCVNDSIHMIRQSRNRVAEKWRVDKMLFQSFVWRTFKSLIKII